MAGGGDALRTFRAAVAVVAVIALGLGPVAHAETRESEVNDNFYLPAMLEIRAGDTVAWRHVGSAPHTVTHQTSEPEQEEFDSHPDCEGTPLNPLDCMENGDTYSLEFGREGLFPYFCKVHGERDVPPDPARGPQDQPCGMCGLIRVIPTTMPTASTVTPTPRPAPTPAPTRSPPTPVPTDVGTPSPSATPLAPVTPTPTITGTPPTFAAPQGGDDETSTARLFGLLAAAVALVGAGALAWWNLLRAR